MKLNNLGWILTAGMGAALFAGGFQTQTNKIGVVDLQAVFQTSDMYQTKDQLLKGMSDTRSDILTFLQTYPTITAVQAQRFRNLSLKTDITGAEKTELDKLKADVMANDQAFKALQQKASPTPAEVSKLQAFSSQVQQTSTLSQTWAQEFNDDINKQKLAFRDQVLDKATGAVQDLAKKQGYTLIFTKDVVPYASNDVTPDTLKVMNAKK